MNLKFGTMTTGLEQFTHKNTTLTNIDIRSFSKDDNSYSNVEDNSKIDKLVEENCKLENKNHQLEIKIKDSENKLKLITEELKILAESKTFEIPDKLLLKLKCKNISKQSVGRLSNRIKSLGIKNVFIITEEFELFDQSDEKLAELGLMKLPIVQKVNL
jgi:uncharacterized protein YaaW (UPF0174 family)